MIKRLFFCAVLLLWCLSLVQSQVTITGDVLFPENTDCGPEEFYSSVPNVEVVIENLDTTLLDTMVTGMSGDFMLAVQSGRVKLTPEIAPPTGSSDWKNGISTLDQIIIQKHINDLDLIKCPFKRIASDVEGDGDIDGSDIAMISSLILGTLSSFPDVPNWRFIPKPYGEPSTIHPYPKFLGNFWNNNKMSADSVEYPFAATMYHDGDFLTYNGSTSWMDTLRSWYLQPIESCKTSWGFYIVKSGDANGSADITSISPPPFTSSPVTEVASAPPGLGELSSSTALSSLSSETFLIDVMVSSHLPLEGYQLGAIYNPEVLQVIGINETSEILEQDIEGNFNLNTEDFQNGFFRTIWINNFEQNPEGIFIEGPTKLFSIKVAVNEVAGDIQEAFFLSPDALPTEFYSGSKTIQEGLEVWFEIHEDNE